MASSAPSMIRHCASVSFEMVPDCRRTGQDNQGDMAGGQAFLRRPIAQRGFDAAEGQRGDIALSQEAIHRAIERNSVAWLYYRPAFYYGLKQTFDGDPELTFWRCGDKDAKTGKPVIGAAKPRAALTQFPSMAA